MVVLGAAMDHWGKGTRQGGAGRAQFTIPVPFLPDQPNCWLRLWAAGHTSVAAQVLATSACRVAQTRSQGEWRLLLWKVLALEIAAARLSRSQSPHSSACYRGVHSEQLLILLLIAYGATSTPNHQHYAVLRGSHAGWSAAKKQATLSPLTVQQKHVAKRGRANNAHVLKVRTRLVQDFLDLDANGRTPHSTQACDTIKHRETIANSPCLCSCLAKSPQGCTSSNSLVPFCH
jgi:hypothetical protein